MVQNNPILKASIGKLWNTFWSGGISNPLTAIEQITYLLFIKRLDALESQREAEAQHLGFAYKSRFEGTYVPYNEDASLPAPSPRPASELRWGEFRTISSPDDLLHHVRHNVFPFIKKLNGSSTPFTKYMSTAAFGIEKASLLVEAIKQIEEIFKEIDRDAALGGHSFQDIQGDVYERLLDGIATAGKNGQFRTPRHIIKLVADLMQPKLGEQVCDPACGTAGFLLGAYQFILGDIARREDPSRLIKDGDGFERGALPPTIYERFKESLESSLFGFDIDVTMVRLGLMNLMMHGIDNPHIEYRDTLSKSYTEEFRYDVIMANPPFTGSVDKGDINENLVIKTSKTELLFVERIHNMLKDGGRAAIIVPQGVLFGSSKAHIELRKKLVEEARTDAVITLPSGVFKPYAGVATAILIFSKGYTTDHIWFYDLKDDSYELNDKRTEKFHDDGNRNFGDLHDLVDKYRNRNNDRNFDRSYKSFFISQQEIAVNNYDLSYNRYKEYEDEEGSHESPQLILEKLKSIEGTIARELDQLMNIIG